MGSLFDIFSTQPAQNAADAQKAGIEKGYGDLSGLFSSGRDALNSNFTAGLQPYLANQKTATAGTGALSDALGLNGAEGNARAKEAFWNNPAIQSQLDIGSENVMRHQAATGQLASGKTNVDLQNLGQQIASNGWNNYVSSLQPFLNFSQGTATGIGNLYSNLGTNLNANFMNQGNAAYGAATSAGNAQANADLADYNASANMWGALIGGGKLAGKLFGMFADGGRPPVGKPILVGERGPEVIILDRPGTVVPNHAVGFSNRNRSAASHNVDDRRRAMDEWSGSHDKDRRAMDRAMLEWAGPSTPSRSAMQEWMGPSERSRNYPIANRIYEAFIDTMPARTSDPMARAAGYNDIDSSTARSLGFR
jgi:hypothetical protein